MNWRQEVPAPSPPSNRAAATLGGTTAAEIAQSAVYSFPLHPSG
jgi:hypothetical protein